MKQNIMNVGGHSEEKDLTTIIAKLISPVKQLEAYEQLGLQEQAKQVAPDAFKLLCEHYTGHYDLLKANKLAKKYGLDTKKAKLVAIEDAVHTLYRMFCIGGGYSVSFQAVLNDGDHGLYSLNPSRILYVKELMEQFDIPESDVVLLKKTVKQFCQIFATGYKGRRISKTIEEIPEIYSPIPIMKVAYLFSEKIVPAALRDGLRKKLFESMIGYHLLDKQVILKEIKDNLFPIKEFDLSEKQIIKELEVIAKECVKKIKKYLYLDEGGYKFKRHKDALCITKEYKYEGYKKDEQIIAHYLITKLIPLDSEQILKQSAGKYKFSSQKIGGLIEGYLKTVLQKRKNPYDIICNYINFPLSLITTYKEHIDPQILKEMYDIKIINLLAHAYGYKAEPKDKIFYNNQLEKFIKEFSPSINKLEEYARFLVESWADSKPPAEFNYQLGTVLNLITKFDLGNKCSQNVTSLLEKAFQHELGERDFDCAKQIFFNGGLSLDRNKEYIKQTMDNLIEKGKLKEALTLDKTYNVFGAKEKKYLKKLEQILSPE